MTNVYDIIDPLELDAEVNAGYINQRYHPEYPYVILNYSEKAQFENRWTDTIRNCRGLIYNHDTEEVVARGMPKFFNHGQPGAAEIALDEAVFSADKVDGSLGIQYVGPDGHWAVATRGSFTSDQALHATEVLHRRSEVSWMEGHTKVFEIVYPENRIVLNYGDRDELIYLGHVNNATGHFTPADVTPGEHFGWMTLGRALSLPPRKNAEGLVLSTKDGRMVKVKQEDYLRLHKAIFGLSARKLWEIIALGGDMDAYIAALPDELQPWAKETVRSLFVLHDAKIAYLQETFNEIMDTVERIYGAETWDRADFAREVTIRGGADTGYLFALLDGKDIDMMLWRRSRPEAGISPVLVDHGEDVA